LQLGWQEPVVCGICRRPAGKSHVGNLICLNYGSFARKLTYLDGSLRPIADLREGFSVSASQHFGSAIVAILGTPVVRTMQLLEDYLRWNSFVSPKVVLKNHEQSALRRPVGNLSDTVTRSKLGVEQALQRCYHRRTFVHKVSSKEIEDADDYFWPIFAVQCTATGDPLQTLVYRWLTTA
jgi:hypothetical protein